MDRSSTLFVRHRRRGLLAILILGLLSTLVAPAYAADYLVVNEFSASTTGTDVEYIELYGSPNTDYSSYKILGIEGDFTGTVTGLVDNVINVGTTDSEGLLLINLAANTLENGSLSLLLVQNFSGSAGNDLDTNDDGILDSTPWTALVDSIAVNDGGATDLTYGGVTLGVAYDGEAFAPGGASRIPNGKDTNTTADWIRNDFDLAGIPSFAGTLNSVEALNTPGEFNKRTNILTPVLNEFSASTTGTDVEYIEVFGSPNTDYSGYTLIGIEGDFAGTVTGLIDNVFAVGMTDANGFWLNNLAANTLENGTISFLLVEGFTGAAGNDLDTNDDGTLDSMPWGALIDAVAVHDGGTTDRAYGGVTLNVMYDGQAFAPGGASRIPNGTDTNATADWVRNDFDLAGIPGFTGTLIAGEALNTPGAVNSTSATDNAPTVSSTTPADNAVDVPVGNDIVINFSEAVTVTDPWFAISCTTGGSISASVTGGPTSYTLNPATDLTAGDSCTVTVTAAQVVDQDGTPTPMASDYSFDFTTAGGAVCSTSFTQIPTLQENGANYGLPGPFTVEGIVVADFQTSAQQNGFYIQSAAGDGNPLTSDGIFVFDPQPPILDVVVGQRVRVTGTVSEFVPSGAPAGETQITATAITDCGDTGTITPVELTLPFPSTTYLEQFEGMLVNLPQTLYATEVFFLGRHGEVLLSSGGRLWQPTNVALPGAPAQAAQATNDLNKIYLDDGLNAQNPDPTPYIYGSGPTLRVGDVTSNITGVIAYEFPASSAAGYRIHPTAAVTFAEGNPRPTAPVKTGEIRVISFNVLNYFNGDGAGGGFPTSRGASTAIEFERQSDKIVAAISQLNPDVAGLIEMENDAGATSALAELVNRLNDEVGAGTYAYVETGVIGTDEIKVAFIYKPAVVSLVGAPMVDLDPIHNRPPVAQTFEQVGSGARFNVVINHFKSKGCDGATGLDLDLGDGQSCWNALRLDQAEALDEFVQSVVIPTSGEADVLIIGDLNSYMREDPIRFLEDAGYVNLTMNHVNDAYSYVFGGQSGTLDHAIGTASLAAQVVDVVEWHINPDEPSILDYNMEFKSDAQDALNLGTPYRSSDHDPVAIDLNLGEAPATPTPISPTGVIGELQPIFTWTQVTGAEYYYLWISKGSDHVLDQWYYFGDVCDGTTCSAQLPFLITEGGDYNWWVQAWHPVGGYSAWSAMATFTLAVEPATPTPIAPIGEITDTNPLFQWSESASATFYHIWVSQIDGPEQGYVTDEWLEAGTVCSGGTCSVDLGLALENGAYGWWIQAFSEAGGYSEWSTRVDFSVVLPIPAPTPVSPTGSITNQTPTFTFRRVTGATWYYLWVSSGPNKIIDQWYSGASICGAVTCSVTPSLSLQSGAYRWWVQAWSPYGGNSPWSSATDFTVAIAPATPVQVAPQGSILQTNPTYSWQRSVGATHYYIWVSGPGGYVLDRWFDASAVCTGANCSAMPNVPLANGVHRWWIQAWNPWGGFSGWSGEMIFNVNGPGAVGEPAGEGDGGTAPILPVDVVPAPVEPIVDPLPDVLPPDAAPPADGAAPIDGG